MRVLAPLAAALAAAALAAAALAAAGMALPAAAQTPDLDRLRLQDLQQQNMRAQEQANILQRQQADLRQAQADQLRSQTEANLLAAQRPLQTPNALTPTAVPDPITSADEAALARLRARLLAESNARLRAITPAP